MIYMYIYQNYIFENDKYNFENAYNFINSLIIYLFLNVQFKMISLQVVEILTDGENNKINTSIETLLTWLQKNQSEAKVNYHDIFDAANKPNTKI